MSPVETETRADRTPGIRIRPVPPCDPPFDDELSPDIWASPDQLAFEWPSPGPGGGIAAQITAAPAAGAPGRREEPARPPSGAAAVGFVPGASGDAKLAVRRFVHLCVEVLNGHRPAAQLRRLSLPKEAGGVVAQAVAGARRVAETRPAARSADQRSRRAGPVAVLRLLLCEPRPGAVEAAVLLVTGERTWAMALRLEFHQQAWAATVLRLI
jgi:hypothetical protein